jgi:hypothetical protein
MTCLDIEPKQHWLSASAFIHSMITYLGAGFTDVQVDAISGFAFRNAIWDGLLPGAFNSSFHWYDAFQSAFDRLGFLVEIVLTWGGQKCYGEYKDYVWDKISKSIESKKPVLIWESFEFALVIDINNDKLTINGISGRKTIDKTDFGMGDIPSIFAVFPIMNLEISVKSSALMTLRTAVTVGLMDKPPYASHLHPAQGTSSYKKWQEELEGEFNLFGNAQYIRILLQARRSSALYLAESAKAFKGLPQNLLLRASERFAQVHAKLVKMAKLFPFPKKDMVYPDPDMEEAKKLLEDCYIMETEGLNLMATTIEHLDAQVDIEETS